MMKRIILIIILVSCISIQNIPLIDSHTISQDDSIVWHYDCSNTTGFSRVDEWKSLTPITYGEMESDGNYISFNNVTDIGGQHGPTFVHEFDEPFQLVALEDFSTSMYIHSTEGQDRGHLYVYLMDEMYNPVVFSYYYEPLTNPSISAFYGNRFYPFHSEYVSHAYVPYSTHSELTHNMTFTFTMGDDKIISSYDGSSSRDIYTNLGIDGGRSIKYLVIEYGEYDEDDYDYDLRIYDIYLKYNTHAVIPDESLGEYYKIPRNYLWYGLELLPGIDLIEQVLDEDGIRRYYAVLEPGTWKITVDHETWLETLLNLTIDNITTSSGSSSGDFPEITFTISKTTFVLIDVIENSIDGSSSGFYDIELVPIIPGVELVIPTMIGSFIICTIVLIGYVIKKSRKDTKIEKIESFDILIEDVPEEYRKAPEDSSESYRVFRLPTKCPHCSGPLKHEEIDWVGPAQAECPYCNGVVNARFEKL